MMWTKLFDLGICFFEGYISFSFWKSFLKLRTKNINIHILVMAIAMTILFGFNRFHIAGLNLAASMTLSAIACQTLFIDSPKKKLFYVMVSTFVLLCCEFVMSGILSLPLGENTTPLYEDPARVVILTISSKLISFVVLRWISQASDNGRNIFFASLVPYFSIFPFSCLILYVGIAYSSINFVKMSFSSIIVLLGSILLLIANIVLFIVYDRMIYMMNQVKEYELINIKQNLENQHYMQIEEINRKHTGIIHDMSNYMKTIETLALKENNEKIVDLIESLNRHILKVGEEHYCNHQILNAILNGKKQEAEQQHVNYDVYVEMGFEKPDVEDIDLISIMSNLIDNAIEAASKCSDGYVKVKLYKANDGRFTTIKITNNYKEKPVEKDGEFLSRKQNPSMHGIGIRNVKSIVERYGGWTNIEYEEDQFCVTIMFA